MTDAAARNDFIPLALPLRGRGGGGREPHDPQRLGDAGAAGRGVRGGVRRVRGCRLRACGVRAARPALHLGLVAVGVVPGDEVITVSHSFVATANSVRYCGATPVFVDIEPGTYNIDPALVERVDHAEDPRHPRRAPDGDAVRHGGDRAARPGQGARGRRGLRLRRRQRDPVGRPVGEDRPAARRRRLLLVPPAEGHHHRRRRDDHHRPSRTGPSCSGCSGSTA